MYYELDSAGMFICDILEEPTLDKYHDWTAVPIPQPIYTPYLVGTRSEETGEWVGTWEDHGPKPVVSPLPAQDDIIQITRSGWNALCVAAGVHEMQR